MGGVSCVLDVQMVTAIEAEEQLSGVVRVAHNRVEVDYAVEFVAGMNPGVDLLSDAFLQRAAAHLLGGEAVEVGLAVGAGVDYGR